MIKFTKMEGAGNDYVYVDASKYKIENPSELAIKVSNRHFGIGSDGLILVCPSDKADFKMRIFNSDGSEAEMCGNGIRCTCKFIYDHNLSKKDTLTIETLGGIKTIKLNIENNTVKSATVNMGTPILEPKLIPVISDENPVTNLKLNILDKEFTFTCVSVGNPHAVTFVKDLDNFDIGKYGKEIEKHSVFPNKTNVEFVEIIDKNNVKMRVWERGAGETMACGTGSSATCVACNLNNLTERKINVFLLGGKLEINWESDNNIYMTGPATTVFEGEIEID